MLVQNWILIEGNQLQFPTQQLEDRINLQPYKFLEDSMGIYLLTKLLFPKRKRETKHCFLANH